MMLASVSEIQITEARWSSGTPLRICLAHRHGLAATGAPDDCPIRLVAAQLRPCRGLLVAGRGIREGGEFVAESLRQLLEHRHGLAPERRIDHDQRQLLAFEAALLL